MSFVTSERIRPCIKVQQVIVQFSILLSLLLIQSAMATSNLDAVAKGNAEFSRNFLKALAKEEGNLVASPLSCLIALAMTHAGAKGKTALEMTKGLSLPEDLEVTRNGFAELIAALNNSPKVELAIANKIYVRQNFALLSDFTSTLTKSFNASAENVNFVDAGTPGLINKWVEVQTKDKIKDLIQSDAFDDMTRLVLINAVYFKGPWLYPFDKQNTNNRDFFTDETNKIQVPFMYQKKHFGYADLEDLNAELLELPYEGRELSLVIILPKSKTGLAELEKKLETAELPELIKRASKREVEVYLPKFKIETTLDLEPHLTSMGLGHMFSNEADFSGISTAEPLRVSKVVQKAFIEVSEEGTEAAAATVVQIALMSASLLRPPVVVCDRPFRYYLTYKRQIDLFGGRLASPA